MKKMTGLAAGALLAAAVLAFPTPSQAQVPDDVYGGRDSRASRDRYGDADTYRLGYDRGYQDGLDRAGKNRSRADGRDLIHDSKYRKGDAGYKKSYGPRQEYIAGYRDGYEQAFRRGYRTADDGRVRGGGPGGWSREPAERDDPYDYGRDGRYGRESDDRWGTDPADRDRRSDDRNDTRIDPRDDDYDDDVIYEEPPGRW
jgi:hypothetical protein